MLAFQEMECFAVGNDKPKMQQLVAQISAEFLEQLSALTVEENKLRKLEEK